MRDRCIVDSSCKCARDPNMDIFLLSLFVIDVCIVLSIFSTRLCKPFPKSVAPSASKTTRSSEKVGQKSSIHISLKGNIPTMSLKWPVATDIPVLMAALQIQRKTQTLKQTLSSKSNSTDSMSFYLTLFHYFFEETVAFLYHLT